jgi:hypothetical protein
MAGRFVHQSSAAPHLRTTVMQFHAKYVSTDSSVGGDDYQASFHAEEDTDGLDDNSPYLLIQRDFEMSYGRSCYIEAHDERYRGHFSVRRIEFTPDKLTIQLKRPKNNTIQVTYRLTPSEFDAASHVMKIISGEIDPDPE